MAVFCIFDISLIIEPADMNELTPRLFQLKSETGTFTSDEIISPAKTDQFNCPFPVLQDDLYFVDQPGKTLRYFVLTENNRSPGIRVNEI